MAVRVRVRAVLPDAPVRLRRHVLPGDVLESVNGHPVRDLLDLRFYATEETVTVTLRRAAWVYAVRLRYPPTDLGLDFCPDENRRCKNRCVFCFVDQLPPGLRESLYFKDDDARLSFLYGNYITLTNLDARDVQRILEMRISPLRVSIHTMDPVLRQKMMGNPKAGEALKLLPIFADAGLEIDAQLVLCPGLNDGDALTYTLDRLCALGGAVKSVAAVPVGLTRYREGLTALRPFTKSEAADVVQHMAVARQAYPGVEIFPGDEFFLLADHPFPNITEYGTLRQFENGVGMSASFTDMFERTVAGRSCTLRHAVAATGTAFAPTLQKLLARLPVPDEAKRPRVLALRNDFFGGNVSVSGLLTAQDVCAQVRTASLPGDSTLLLPGNMFRAADGLTLDDQTIADIARATGLRTLSVADAAALADILCG
jgi:putative radical SAM enzyme (TIGR03279 family)